MIHTVVITSEARLARDFARIALKLEDERELIIVCDGNGENMLRSLDPKKVTCYYLWIRPTPLMTPQWQNLEMAKTLGFRPVCVVDW